MFLKVVFAILLAIGVFFTCFGVYFIVLGNEARNWPEAQGTIVSVTIRSYTPVAGNQGRTRAQRERLREYYPEITYRWEVDGQSYTGSRYTLGTTHEKYDERTEAVAAALKYRNGAPISVYYDPRDPSEAVLDKSRSGAVFVPLPLGLLFAAAGWLGLKKIDVVQRAFASGAAEPIDPI